MTEPEPEEAQSQSMEMSSGGDTGVSSPPITDLADYQHLQKTLR